MTKILVVDDDPTLLRFLQDFLREEKYSVIAAANGNEALRQAYREHPDLVVLDVMMPGMDGWEVTARLRELSDVPIILLTAKSSEADKLRGFGLGVDDYLTKPFSFAELNARIQAVLNRARHKPLSERNLLQIGDLEVDLDRREVRRAGQPLTLTPTEFRLLEVLARNAGKAVAETELVREVWGAYRQENTTTVRRYIFLLRKKIEPQPDEPRYILTVRGYGYRLEGG
ncbi:response regulator transcription factor [Bellilinea sp.]|uniref:response regulator transcription factor n=1 Tax=Bellilinea sp. TaxID=2838785 RepID=UPI002ADD4257|nr:response regulator transcription factor [Bellilinea sp.]